MAPDVAGDSVNSAAARSTAASIAVSARLSRRASSESLRASRPSRASSAIRPRSRARVKRGSRFDDPSNRDPRFTRARLRGLMAELAREGLDARRLSLLARRLKRADTAIEAAVDRAAAELTLSP